MSTIHTITEPIARDLKEFEPYFRSMMKSKAPLLNIITNYIIKRKGKQMRPMFVFLTAKLHGEIGKSTFHAASLIELMHTATLIHDDVVDDSLQRRGFFSINALWKNKIAVLVGDYLLARGLLLAVDNEEFDLLKIVSSATKEMSEGELLQIEKARKLDITEEVYFEIIRQKTATLISACSEAGARSVNASAEDIARMKKFGEYVGITFQIRDDIFDYNGGTQIGKPTGNDIKEKKMTLPLIYVLNNSTSSERRKIISVIKRKNNDTARVKELVSHVIEKGGIEYATKRMNDYRNMSLEILDHYPDSPAKTSLKEFIRYTTERKK